MKQTKTIPFDWELYNNNRDKYKVVTRYGYEVTQLYKFDITTEMCLRVLLKNNIESYTLNGNFYPDGINKHDLQLQYEEEVVESWVNLYKADDGTLYTSNTYTSKNYAENSRNLNNYIKTINLNDLV